MLLENIDEEFIENTTPLIPIDKSIVLFYCVKKLTEHINHLNCSLFQKMQKYVLFWQYKEYRKKINWRKKNVFLCMTKIKELLPELNHLWQDPKASGVTDSSKVKNNDILLQQIYKSKSCTVHQSIVDWRLITLALLSDRLQPARIIVPYIRSNMQMTEIENTHSALHQLSTDVKNIISSPLIERDVIDMFLYRVRNLCVTLEENCPQGTKFEYFYMSVE
ncbi:hypothetical protein [Candidatus Uabimicrobium sp. HlEnr_7]|uniref:hypothetical protein n=1 Tax=Candidatus Uabimicrobium helgolandensis TaxID=3095367 RepID=UPI0035587B80